MEYSNSLKVGKRTRFDQGIQNVLYAIYFSLLKSNKPQIIYSGPSSTYHERIKLQGGGNWFDNDANDDRRTVY